MDQQRRNLYLYLVTILGFVVVSTIAYHLGMAMLESRPKTLVHSFQVVIETISTTGYGSDAPWEHPLMNLLVVWIQITGILLIFTALPVILLPWIEEALASSAPTSLEDISDHVILAGASPQGLAFIDELAAWDREYVIIEPDRERANELFGDGFSVIHGDPEAAGSLENAGIDNATALIADTDDEHNASIVLTARHIVDDLQIVSLAEEPELSRYHRFAGADQVHTPRHLLADGLCAKVLNGVSTDLEGIEIGSDFEIVELTVQAESDIAGRTLADSGIRERTGAHIIGAWNRGEFSPRILPESRLTAGMILLAAGNEYQLERLRNLTRSRKRHFGQGRVVIIGHGEVGQTIRERLEAENVPCTVIDRVDDPHVDIVGDATEEAVLEQADLENARTVILAIPDDTMTIFATLVLSQLQPEVEILARADAADSVKKLYRAGADYVLSLATISGRILASTVLDEEEVISFNQNIEVVKFDPGALAGETLAEADIRAKTGCTVVAIERNGELLTEIDGMTPLQEGDELVVAGTDEAITAFTELLSD